MISHSKGDLMSEGGFLGGLMMLFGGMFQMGAPNINVTKIKIKTSCHKSCPRTFKNQKVLVDEANR